MARLRRCRRGPLLIILTLASLVYIYSWVVSGIMDEDSDWLDVRSRREDYSVTRKPDPTKPPIHFRHQEVKDRCEPRPQTLDHLPLRPLRFPMDPLISRDPNIFFCPLAKAGSTFFTRYLISMKKPGPMENPYNIDIKDASRHDQDKFGSFRSHKDKADFLTHSTKVVFTRNPYSRIFSAYVDKLFSPNPYYWKDWGKKTIVLNGLDPEKYPCGSQVSFKDFVKTVTSGLWKKDLHFIPMDYMCRLCEVEYDIIGRVEESSTDIEYLSNRLNVSSKFLHDKSYKTSAVEDAVKDSTGDAISTWRQEISNCISLYDSGRIVWRKLQLRGLIDAGVEFPFSEKDMDNVDLERFRLECLKAVNISTDVASLKRQKQVAYQYAYSTLPQIEIVKLQNVYKRDFMLLGYDSTRPDASISELGGLDTSDPMDWRKNWEFT